MEWFNLHLSTLAQPEFVGAEPVHRATWLSLVAWCCRVENMGVINGCKAWGNRRWMQTCGVTLEEVEKAGELYWFDGEDMHVFGYPVGSQNKLEVKRKIAIENGKKGGRRKMVETDVETEPETDIGTNVGSYVGTEVGTEVGTDIGKRKEREGKVRKENLNNHQSSSARAGAGGESPLSASIAAAEDIPEAVPVNPAPPQPPRRPSCGEPYPETVEEVEKAMLATTGLRPQGDDLTTCAASYLDDRSIRGWMTKTANPVPIADWRRDCLNFARLWAENARHARPSTQPGNRSGPPRNTGRNAGTANEGRVYPKIPMPNMPDIE